MIIKVTNKLKQPKPRKTRVKKVKEAQTPIVSVAVPFAISETSIDFKYGLVTGPAGSGKTYRIRKILESDSQWGLVTATTGAAARVLGDKVPTINSALGFFDLESLERAYAEGTLRKNIRTLGAKYERIIIDEASMISSQMFDFIFPACEAEGVGLILVGDFLQLPPITKDFKPPSWLFNSARWSKFIQNGQNVVRLSTQYRHTNNDFIKGLNHLRAGQGGQALPYLKKAGVTFSPVPTVGKPDNFDGVVLCATNSSKDNIDTKRYDEIESKEVTYATERWGKQRKEWKEIADTVSLKVGCRVMILRNLYEEKEGRTTLTQVNGETGSVFALYPDSVEVARDDGSVVNVAVQKTDNATRRTLLNHDESRLTETITKPTGGVEYLPLCRAFALTAHKAQGLTIASPTQIPLWQDEFWKTPAMVYVAASRVKNPEDLTIVGADMLWSEGKPLLEEKCRMDKNCSQWV